MLWTFVLGRATRAQVFNANPTQGLSLALDTASGNHDFESIIDAASSVTFNCRGFTLWISALKVLGCGESDFVCDGSRRTLVLSRKLGCKGYGGPAKILT